MNDDYEQIRVVKQEEIHLFVAEVNRLLRQGWEFYPFERSILELKSAGNNIAVLYKMFEKKCKEEWDYDL